MERAEKRRDWPVVLVHSHAEMDEVDDAFYESLTNQQRLDIMVELVARHQHLGEPIDKTSPVE